MVQENAAPLPLIGVDVGCDTLVTASSSVASTMLPTLVRNNLSNDATPTALTFKEGGERELGEGAIGAPASNAANFFSGAFITQLGDSSFRATVPSIHGGEGQSELRGAQLLAMLLRDQASHAERQLGAAPARAVLALPVALGADGVRAAADAAAIARLGETRLASSAAALAYHYAERHSTDLFPALDARSGGAAGGTDAPAPEQEARETTVLLVDVGHLASSAAVARFTQGVDGAASAALLASHGSFAVGAGVVDDALMRHFAAELAGKHGADACAGAKFELRLRRACARLKTLLSTVDQAKVDGDSIVPDADVQLALSRGAMEGLLADPLAALRALLADALAAAGVAPDALAAVEVVGGGARIPCIVDEVRRAVGGAALSRTLDSSAAVALGAAGLARYWAAREAGGGDASSAEGAAAEWTGVAMEGAWLDGAGGAGMDADAIAGAASDEEMLQGKERLRAEREGARNSLEEWVYQMRDATAGPFAEHLKPAEVNADLDGIEEWLWSEEGESAGAEALRARLAAAKLAMEEKFPVFFEERHLDQKRREVEEAAEEERRRAEAALTEKEDHDNRALKFADRFPMADKNKNEGTELFKGGNFKPAAERYIKALGHLAKLVHVEQMMKEEEHAQARALKVSCHNNLAMCFLKLELWGKAAENASKVLELEADNSKAMFRRAQAKMQLKEFDDAAADLTKCLALSPDDAAVRKLKERAEKEVKAREAKAKKVYSKMFG